MATKRRPPLTKQSSPPQPLDESSEDEEEVESEEERSGKQSQSKALDDDEDSDEGNDSGEEGSESEPEQPTLNRPHSAAASPAVASNDDEGDEGDESRESDWETEEEQPVPNPPAPRSTATGKLANGDSPPESGKDAAAPGESEKKSIRRIWSDVDQVTLLKGMVDYIETEGRDPIANIEGFWLFVRKKLSFIVTELQLIKKMRFVKSKYRINQGKNRVFHKAYDAEVFELSKKVWGSGEKCAVIESVGGMKRKGDELLSEIDGNDEVEWENETVSLSMKHIGWSEDSARVKIKSIAESERKSLVQSWKKLKAVEVRTLIFRTALEVDTLKTIF